MEPQNPQQSEPNNSVNPQHPEPTVYQRHSSMPRSSPVQPEVSPYDQNQPGAVSPPVIGGTGAMPSYEKARKARNSPLSSYFR